MNEIRNRASEQLPSVLLTILSIIQAIALESLWSHTVEHARFQDLTFADALGWVQAIITLMIIVLVWLLYVAYSMRFLWTPDLSDTVLPIFVGIAQFALIEFALPDRLGLWLISLGILTAMLAYVDHRFISKARRDDRNKAFFEMVSRATWRDFALQAAYVIFALVLGIVFLFVDPINWFTVAAMIVVAGVILHTAREQVRYWKISMRAD